MNFYLNSTDLTQKKIQPKFYVYYNTHIESVVHLFPHFMTNWAVYFTMKLKLDKLLHFILFVDLIMTNKQLNNVSLQNQKNQFSSE